jgi:glyoxylate reductase
VAHTGRFDKELVDALPSSVKSVSHNGAGYDQIDVPACTAKGIAVSNTPTAVDNATADVAIMLLLGALRRSWTPVSALRKGDWRGKMTLGHDPEGKTLGILGMGGIGGALAKRAKAFEMDVVYHNRNKAEQEHGARYVDFDELLSKSDVISIHLPLSEKTTHFIGKEQFAKMKDGVVLVNTARGAVIDESALVEALENGKVWSAGLDVYEKEPEIHPGLIKNENVVLFPHIGTATIETQKKMEVLVVDNVKSMLKDGKLLTQVQEQKGKSNL